MGVSVGVLVVGEVVGVSVGVFYEDCEGVFLLLNLLWSLVALITSNNCNKTSNYYIQAEGMGPEGQPNISEQVIGILRLLVLLGLLIREANRHMAVVRVIRVT